MRRITIISISLALFIAVCTAVVAGYSLYKINRAISSVTEPDITTLEKLISEKVITLTREQKQKLLPLVRELTDPGQAPEKVRELKEKMWSTLKPEQIEEIKKWREKTESQARKFVKQSKFSVSDEVEKYRNMSEKGLEKRLDGLSSWWDKHREKEAGRDIIKMLEGY